MAMTWIDTHSHFSERNADGSQRENVAQGVVKVLDASGADLRFVLSPGVTGNDLAARDEEELGRLNESTRRVVAEAEGRLYGSCFVNPHLLDASLRIMEAAFEQWGFVMLGEMLQYMLEHSMDSDAVERILRSAVEYGAPVQVHISTSHARKQPSSFGREQLLDLFGAVRRVPEAKYVLAHAVGTPKADPPVVDEYLDMVEKEYGAWPENFWMEIADFGSPGLRSALDRVPMTRLISGMDWDTRNGPPFDPYGLVFLARMQGGASPPSGVPQLVKFLEQAGVGEEDIARIGYRNAAEMMGLEA